MAPRIKNKITGRFYKTKTLKAFVFSITAISVLWSCHQIRNTEKEKPHKNIRAEKVLRESVSLSVKPNVFTLAKLPDQVEVTLLNHTMDTITTGLHYSIEHYEKNEWKEVSPELIFHDLGWTILPADSHTFEKKLLPDKINYKVGKYRVVKHYLKNDYLKTRKEFKVYGAFNIE